MTRTTGTIFAASMMIALVTPSFAQPVPTADELLTGMGFSDGDRKRVLAGEFVTADLPPVSPRDLSISIAFLVKTSPDVLAKDITSGSLLAGDPQLKAHGNFHGDGSLTDLTALQITADEASRLSGATAGSAVNLATSEISAFNAASGAQRAVTAQLHQMLLSRYQAYEKNGLSGIAPYDRGGATSQPADDLKSASQAAAQLKKYLPALENVLLSYPQADAAEMSPATQWLKYDIDGAITYVISQSLSAADGDARAIVQRQYYVSTGYNCEQAIAGLLPVKDGTVVVYTNHTFTDQVAGWGGSAKRSIGRRMMESKLQAIFDRDRKAVAR